jgi:hypothetical protein
MKGIRTLGILFLLLVGATVFYWFVAKPELPLDRTIMNNQGKSLEVTIRGKDPVKLHVDRRSDGERFEVPIQSLVWKDRLVAMRLPNQAAPAKVVARKEEAGFVETRLKLIAELTVKLELYEKEVSSQTLNDLLARKRYEDTLKIRNEIKTLEVAIDGYKYRTRSK